MLTRMLAPRCGTLLACDLAAAAVKAAAGRTSDLPVDGWTLGADAAAGGEDDRGPFARLLGTP